ncbi:MAG: GNAT family N-acetyltransferase [Pirellulales bacterium]|nr:GNAT family N-acetyltransferase [Pirellulales bacterium]
MTRYRIVEFQNVDQLAVHRTAWNKLLHVTPGASFFQSLEWLEIYWRHFGSGKALRVLVLEAGGQPTGFLPLIVRNEKTRAGTLRMLTYPLDDWGSFYGPVGPEPDSILREGFRHLGNRPRDWDFLELRWIGAPDARTESVCSALAEAASPGYATVWRQTALVEFLHGWKDYAQSRKGLWRRRLRQAEEKLRQRGTIEYLRYRPAGADRGEDDPRWDLYDQCEALARRSWQAEATDGTTLSHADVQPFLRDVHAAAAAAGAVDLNLLLFDGRPAAFIYGYCWNGYVFGLRRAFDADLSRQGLGNLLLWETLHDSARRGDRCYDMGPGSLESKRHFLTRLSPIWRWSSYPPGNWRTQVLRLRRWWESRRKPLLPAHP